MNAEGINTRFMRAADYSLFLQDDWKLSQKLTLNLGLRYELDLPPYETRWASIILGNQFDPKANGRVSDFDRTHRFVLS